MPFMYILECRDLSYYVGSTWNLEQRMAQHQAGEGADYTRRRLPVVLVFAAEFERIEDAFVMEKRVQGWSRAKRRALIDGRYSDLPNLAKKDFRRGSG
ncbi:MAG TPA: GIY-YIG nuclease family protein [Pseudolysinimonas sp.]|jgi:putative endonuclease|nr:GIY-YIG nuclease family protein [Pseudolysinimonas sp.]